MGMPVFIRHPVTRRDGPFCQLFKLGIGNDIDNAFTRIQYFTAEVLIDKDWRFRYPELDRAGMPAVEIFEKGLVFIGRKRAIERLSDGRDHAEFLWGKLRKNDKRPASYLHVSTVAFMACIRQSRKPKFVIFAPSMMKEKRTIKVAILDLYEGVENQGMRCIRELLNQYGEENDIELTWDEYEVRLAQQIPDLSYDLFISSGGPGSPLESEHTEWEKKYFQWMSDVQAYNEDAANPVKKHVLFICHSFQLACRFFAVANVVKRKSTAFGVFPVHMLEEARVEPVFDGLQDPFYAVDSRDYQVIQPNYQRLRQLGATLLCIEKDRPHVPLERAIMGIRFNENMIGTQFHPEADAVGMTMYLQRDDKKKTVIENHGEAKWQSMITHLNDPDKIRWTYSHIIPNFISYAIALPQEA